MFINTPKGPRRVRQDGGGSYVKFNGKKQYLGGSSAPQGLAGPHGPMLEEIEILFLGNLQPNSIYIKTKHAESWIQVHDVNLLMQRLHEQNFPIYLGTEEMTNNDIILTSMTHIYGDDVYNNDVPDNFINLLIEALRNPAEDEF